jgi:hypothetical protein
LAAYVHAQGIDAERVGDHVQQLPTVTDAVRPPQPERVVEVPVDALRVVTPPVQHFEVWVTRRNLANVLGPQHLVVVVMFGPFGRLGTELGTRQGLRPEHHGARISRAHGCRLMLLNGVITVARLLTYLPPFRPTEASCA